MTGQPQVTIFDRAVDVAESIRQLPDAHYRLAVGAIVVELIALYRPEVPEYAEPLFDAVVATVGEYDQSNGHYGAALSSLPRLWSDIADSVDRDGTLSFGLIDVFSVCRALAWEAESGERAAVDWLLTPFIDLPVGRGGDPANFRHDGVQILSPAADIDSTSQNAKLLEQAAAVVSLTRAGRATTPHELHDLASADL